MPWVPKDARKGGGSHRPRGGISAADADTQWRPSVDRQPLRGSQGRGATSAARAAENLAEPKSKSPSTPLLAAAEGQFQIAFGDFREDLEEPPPARTTSQLSVPSQSAAARRRRAWADMASDDESGSDLGLADFNLAGGHEATPQSPSSASQAAAASTPASPNAGSLAASCSSTATSPKGDRTSPKGGRTNPRAGRTSPQGSAGDACREALEQAENGTSPEASSTKRKSHFIGTPQEQECHFIGTPPPEARQDDLAPAERWASQVHAMAAELLRLASSAPSAGPATRSAEVGTDASAEDLESWREAAERLAEARAVAAELRREAEDEAAAEQRAASLHARRRGAAADKAAKVQSRAAAAEAERQEEYRFAAERLATAAALLAEGRGQAAAAKREARRQEEVRRKAVAKLRAAAEGAATAAAEAQREAETAAERRRQAQALPELKERRRVSQARVETLGKDCEQLGKTVEQVRAQAEAQSGPSSRTEALEQRILQLDKECRELQDTTTGAHVGSMPTPARNQQLENDLKGAQESNRDLVAEVRTVRAARDKADAELKAIQRDIQAAQYRCTTERADLELQVTDLMEAEASARAEVERLRQHVEEQERQVHTEEEAAKRAREKAQEIDAAKRELVLRRRRAEEVATVLEWRLQKAVEQLDKERPGAPMARCLLNAKTGLQHRSFNIGAGAAMKATHPKSRKYHANGSEMDGDSTTAGGESVVGELP